MKWVSARKHKGQFCHKLHGVTISSARGIHKLTDEVSSAVSLLNKKPANKCTVLADQRVDQTKVRHEQYVCLILPHDF